MTYAISPDRVLKTQTNTRMEFIDLFAELAEGISPARFLHDRENIPVILIAGGSRLGKSLAADAMIAQLRDVKTLTYLRPDERERNKLSFESVPCEAARQIVEQRFIAGGKRIKFTFNSSVWSHPLRNDVEKIELDSTVVGGAVFRSVKDKTQSSYLRAQWININIAFPEKAQSGWQRQITIGIQNDQLWDDPQFQDTWAGLTSCDFRP